MRLARCAIMRAMASELFPIVSTPDLDRALAFWRDALGGQVAYEFRDPATAAVSYVGLDVGRSHLGIGVATEPVAGGNGRAISLWIYVDDCDATVARLRDAGTPIVEEPVDQPWGERVARVRDPDGNEVIIGQRASG
jgi:lactoylglutathione lyase